EDRNTEETSDGRASTAYAAGLLWLLANERERGRAQLLLSLEDDPQRSQAWELLVGISGATLAEPASSVAAAWFPNDARFGSKAGSWRADELALRLRDAHLAYILDPGLASALRLGRALGEAGRADEVRELAATSIGTAESNRILSDATMAFVDLHDAKIESALARLEAAGDVAMVDLAVVADVAGQADAVATRWAARFLSRPDTEIEITARGYDTPMLLCMRAKGNLASRCLERVERLGHGGLNWWYEGGTALLAGAKRYAAGDVRGAAASWRPLVASPNLAIARILPTEVFERASEPGLAARLDARKMEFAFIAGVSDAAPREAKRAFASGDSARARRLASLVVQSWEVADLQVPAVAQMRALLGALGDAGSPQP
ncbi:MAG TPA: hypothetical protein VGI39_33295, partial [Polyangiaceae bacterium]